MLPETIQHTALTVLHTTNTSMCFVRNCSSPGKFTLDLLELACTRSCMWSCLAHSNTCTTQGTQVSVHNANTAVLQCDAKFLKQAGALRHFQCAVSSVLLSRLEMSEQSQGQQSCLVTGLQDLPSYLTPGPSANSFNSTDGQIHNISCNQIKLHTRVGPPPAWFQQAALDPKSYNFAFCTCAGNYYLQVRTSAADTMQPAGRHTPIQHTCHQVSLVQCLYVNLSLPRRLSSAMPHAALSGLVLRYASRSMYPWKPLMSKGRIDNGQPVRKKSWLVHHQRVGVVACRHIRLTAMQQEQGVWLTTAPGASC